MICLIFLKGNGYIAVSDLRDILRALDENISEEELDEMIADIDTDGSGTVDFDGKLNYIHSFWISSFFPQEFFENYSLHFMPFIIFEIQYFSN